MGKTHQWLRKPLVMIIKNLRWKLNLLRKDALHLFLLSPPLSGSTAFSELMATAPTVTGFRGNIEGQFLPELEHILLHDQRWNPDFVIDWELAKRVFMMYWSPLKSIRFEKSPPHLVRALQLEKEFANTYFLITIRNPYAFIEGLLRRCWFFNEYGPQSMPSLELTPKIAADFWVRTAEFQLKNMQQLKNVCFFSYEELMDSTGDELNRIIRFLPDIGSLDAGITFSAHNVTGKPIQGLRNLNQEKIANLTAAQIDEINTVLTQHQNLMARFTYQLI
jgi:hypothetical protein